MFKMPINIKEMLEAMVSFEQEGKESVCVDVVFDASASDELIDALYNAFCKSKLVISSQVKTYVLADEPIELRPEAELCVLVGGNSLEMGNVLAQAKRNGSLSMCVVQSGVTTFEERQDQKSAGAKSAGSKNAGAGFDMSSFDMSSFDVTSFAAAKKNSRSKKSAVLRGAELAGSAVKGAATSFVEVKKDKAKKNFDAKKDAVNFAEHIEGINIDDIVVIDPKDEEPLMSVAKWIASRMPKKRISLALQFPFMRHALCMELTQSNAIANAAVAVVAFVPGADMPIITANQAKLVLQIAAIYGQKLDIARAKEILAVIVGAFGFRSIARKFTRFIPVLGVPIKTGVAYSGTLAIGHAACSYFENNGEQKYEEALKIAAGAGKNLLASLLKKHK